MLVAETADAYRLVPQPEHSRQVGEFARHWGNDIIDPPTPRASMLVAAELHDNGWWEHDLQPHLADGEPAGALAVGPNVWPAFYERAVERTADVDPYAAIVVSMHGTGIRRNRYGLSPSMPDYSDEYAEFIQEQEAGQRALLDEVIRASDDDAHAAAIPAGTRSFLASLHDEGVVDDAAGAPPRLYANYARLQAWDQLSIHLCRSVAVEPATIDHVPVADDGETTTLTVTPDDDTTVRLDPYPFDAPEVTAPVGAKTIPKADYTQRSLTEAYFEASMESVAYTFVA
jgi:hypothetical protein